ncbi:S8 family serine peptidase [Candidatus Zixiibacteriota bacterium]
MRNRILKSTLLLSRVFFLWIIVALVGHPAPAAIRPVVSDRVAAELALPGDSANVWVFLHDKDPLGDALTRVAPSTSWISARAVRRHQNKGLPLVTEDDRPLAADAVRELTNAGLAVRMVSRWFGAVSGRADREALQNIAQISWVDSIRIVRTYRRSPAVDAVKRNELPREMRPGDEGLDYGESLTQLAQIRVVDAHWAGYDGSGVYIGFLDTGYNPDHEAFASANVLATRDFINGDEDVADDDPLQMDHGTKSWSACAAFTPETMIGAAYGADFALAKTEIKNTVDIEIEEDYFVAGLEWFDSLGVDIASSSLGYPDFYTYEDLNGRTAITTKGVNRAASRGILVVTAAGNEGNNKSYPWVVPPGDSDSALTVGAVYSSGLKVGFSSIGPTADGRIKPDVMAMGIGVQLADDGGGYTTSQGTSFATPLVAGACALMLQRDPRLMPMEIIDSLHHTASRAESPDSLYGWGIVNLAEAMNLADTLGEEVTVSPNPFSQTVHFSLPGVLPSSTVTTRIFSVAGKLVYSAEGTGPESYWNGLNSAGKEVASGVYLCLFETPNRYFKTKVAFMRR